MLIAVGLGQLERDFTLLSFMGCDIESTVIRTYLVPVGVNQSSPWGLIRVARGGDSQDLYFSV